MLNTKYLLRPLLYLKHSQARTLINVKGFWSEYFKLSFLPEIAWTKTCWGISALVVLAFQGWNCWRNIQLQIAKTIYIFKIIPQMSPSISNSDGNPTILEVRIFVEFNHQRSLPDKMETEKNDLKTSNSHINCIIFAIILLSISFRFSLAFLISKTIHNAVFRWFFFECHSVNIPLILPKSRSATIVYIAIKRLCFLKHWSDLWSVLIQTFRLSVLDNANVH